MPTIKASRNSILGIINGLQAIDPHAPDVSVTWVHGVARNIKLAAKLAADWKAKSEEVNSEAYAKYEAAKAALKDGDDPSDLNEEYREVLADRTSLIEAAEAWLNEEVDHEIYSWPLVSLPANIDRQLLVALTDWIRD